MTTARGGLRCRQLPRVVLAAVVGSLLFPAATFAQGRESLPVDLPNGPAKAGWDIKRFSNLGNGWFETFYVKNSESLQAVLKQGRVAPNTRLLVFETAAGWLALINDQMSFHHIAQGTAGGKDWMATF